MDTTKARRELGWRPKYTALEALRDTVGAPRRVGPRRGSRPASIATQMDSAPRLRDTPGVLGPGCAGSASRRTLNAAYAEGLLSERTLAYRLDVLFAGPS